MPYARPSLSSLELLAAQDIAAGLPGTDPLLRFSNLGVLGRLQAGFASLHFGYLDYIAQQANPFTATGEALEAWGALKGVYRLAANAASGSITFTGTGGATIPLGATIARGDGQKYTTTASATVIGGTATVPAVALADPAGLSGLSGNAAQGTLFTLGQAVAGVNSGGVGATAFTGGADIETDTSLRSRTLNAYQNPAHGGSEADYATWALQVPGVSRAWVVRHGHGAGTVVVYFMLAGGFPVGVNGVATGEDRDSAATGDQLALANYIYPLQPVTALVYACAPSAYAVPFTITGMSAASAATKAAVSAAISTVLTAQGSAKGSTVALLTIEAAIAAIPGTSGFVVTNPTANITNPAGTLPVLGVVTYA